MKKNKAMRAAGGLFIATMLSTSIISGTYAKYVTGDKVEDTARVAKFGVEVTASGYLFSDTYRDAGNGNVPGKVGDENNVNGEGINLSVVSSGTNTLPNNGAPLGTADKNGINGIDKVVAPGTTNGENAFVFSITGKPEVDVEIKFNITNSKEDDGNAADIFLAKGTYPNMTNGNVFDDVYDEDDVFTFDNDYHPIKYTLYRAENMADLEKGIGAPTCSRALDNVTLKEVEEYLEGKFANGSKKVDANTDLTKDAGLGYFKLVWTWNYENTTGENAKKLQDKQDTLLGDLAADGFEAGSVFDALEAIKNSHDGNNNTVVKAEMSAFKELNKASDALKVNAPAASGAYSLNTDIVIDISVTQID